MSIAPNLGAIDSDPMIVIGAEVGGVREGVIRAGGGLGSFVDDRASRAAFADGASNPVCYAPIVRLLIAFVESW